MIVEDKTIGSKLFNLFNYIVLSTLALATLLPFVNLFAISLSSTAATTANLVTFWPIGFHMDAYSIVFAGGRFLQAFWVSVLRITIGTAVNISLIILTAYPLAREEADFRGRNLIIWFYVFPMMFSGGLIPFFMIIREVGLIDNFWVMILPGAVPVFSVIMMMNFFRDLGKELYDAAMIDGAGHLTILTRIFTPLSMPAIATLALFSMVGHWNDWFGPLIFFNDMEKWPLQTYLRQQLVSIDISNLRAEDIDLLLRLSDRSLRAAQIVVATIPIICVYPFLQKYFVKGIRLGSVKE